ncbi:MAG TPA: hypothetical protein VE863_18245 [Pyrinomonadaceae bacterium]|jgi:hypothetical protein|nr:hypothetical protein [Pyrinomonadaceae bacterium]
MGKYDTQRAAFNFLRQHLLSGDSFVLREFIEATGWKKPGTYRTYLQKQYRGLIEPIEGGGFRIALDGRYRVTEAFRQFLEWRKFRQHVTQNRPIGGDYALSTSKVLTYDFLMPLTHETHLRTTLDALSYKDTILAKLKGIDKSEMEEYFGPSEGQSETDYFGRILSFIEKNFVGYSIYHVDGRFRSPGILNFDEIAVLSKEGRRYLIDETTAVTRFIFPYDTDKQLASIQFLFQRLFVKGMIDLVSGEQEIWMLENGPKRLVHIWRAPSDDSAEVDEEDDL